MNVRLEMLDVCRFTIIGHWSIEQQPPATNFGSLHCICNNFRIRLNIYVQLKWAKTANVYRTDCCIGITWMGLCKQNRIQCHKSEKWYSTFCVQQPNVPMSSFTSIFYTHTHLSVHINIEYALNGQVFAIFSHLTNWILISFVFVHIHTKLPPFYLLVFGWPQKLSVSYIKCQRKWETCLLFDCTKYSLLNGPQKMQLFFYVWSKRFLMLHFIVTQSLLDSETFNFRPFFMIFPRFWLLS